MTDLRAALHNLPQWAMVGPMNDRHMEAVRPGQYWSIADVLAALAASAPDEGPTAHLDLRSIREPCTACGASAPDEGPLDSAFTRTLRAYADRAHDNETYRTLVPEVVLRDAAEVIDEYRARPATPAALDVERMRQAHRNLFSRTGQVLFGDYVDELAREYAALSERP